MPNTHTDSANNFGATQVTVDTSGTTLLIAARKSRSGFTLTVEDTGTNTLYYSSSSPVNISTAGFILAGAGNGAIIPYNGAMYGLASSGTKVVSVEELF